MTLGELSQRLRRVDFLDGLGIYVAPNEVALAHVEKKLFTVALRHARTFPLPPAARSGERRQALAQAVLTFAREHKVDTRRAYLCVPRADVAFSRVVLPAAARENLTQVLEYEMEHLVPLPRDQIYYDYSVRPLGGDRLEVLLVSIPRATVQAYLEALEDAFVHPRGIVLASTAIADYLAFCRGGAEGPFGLLLGAGEGIELALLDGGRLVGSQLVPASRVGAAGDLSRSVARQLADGAFAPEQVQLYRWELTNGAGPALPALGDGDLLTLAAGRLEAPPEFFDSREPALLPALGAALDAVREGHVPVNLLPEEGRAYDEGLSVTTVVLFVATVLLLVVWGVSAIVVDYRLRSQVQAELAMNAPQVQRARDLQNEIDDLRKQLEILLAGQDRRVTVILKELSEIVPPDAYLTSINLRNERLTLDGYARQASDVITALTKSKRFKNANFTSPTTKTGDKERFSLVAELEK
ncbi:MAG TPA: PilN domain-containing protein [Candidatus Binatia bacterium]|nr:PilN domain-containing protein [Candidatus Binatia bacterium]